MLKCIPMGYIRMYKTVENKFMSICIALQPMMQGFELCRLVFIVDVVHLSGEYRGMFV